MDTTARSYILDRPPNRAMSLKLVELKRDELASGYLNPCDFFAWIERDVLVQSADEPDQSFELRVAAYGIEPDFERSYDRRGNEQFVDTVTGRNLADCRKAAILARNEEERRIN